MNQKTPMRPLMPSDPSGGRSAGERIRRDRELLIMLTVALSLLLLLLAFFTPVAWRRAQADAALEAQKKPDSEQSGEPSGELNASTNGTATDTQGELPVGNEPDYAKYMPAITDATLTIEDGALDASHAILVDLTTGEALAQRLADERIYPASMTKIMTVLVAAEMLSGAELEMTVTMSAEIVDAAIREGASRAGFEPEERVKLIDLLYGAALPSGADATSALARYLAGSEAQYVELMNQKAEKLGLENTHFVNASGLHDDGHYSTVREIAALMSYAMDNELCRRLLSAASYTTSATDQHPYGITLYSTTFSRMTSTSFGPVSVIAGKTGYTEEARFCLVSLATRPGGREYVLVTVGGSSKYAPVSDCNQVYGKYLF
jgi:D-alanyl-D-alanine carboxypeptidase (penicillin-binding protein 5/6)